MRDFDPSSMSDEEIDRRLAEEFPPDDFDVLWWWTLPDERRGFCVRTVFRHVVTIQELEAASTP